MNIPTPKIRALTWTSTHKIAIFSKTAPTILIVTNLRRPFPKIRVHGLYLQENSGTSSSALFLGYQNAFITQNVYEKICAMSLRHFLLLGWSETELLVTVV
jgi:hypothetical protein